MSVTLVTKRLVLRPWTDDDLEPFVEMAQDPQVMAHIGSGEIRTRDEAESSFANVQATWLTGDTEAPGLFAIDHLDDQRFVGFCGLASPGFLPQPNNVLEIGWRLASWAWGQGLATEAATAVLDWAFDETRGGHERLIAVIQLDNARSIRMAEQLGMTVERRTFVAGHRWWVDVYEMTAATWHARDETAP